MNKELLKQGYLGPVKSTAMIYEMIFSLLREGGIFPEQEFFHRNKEIRKVIARELRKIRKSDTLIEKVVTGESRGQKHYYKKEPFEAYVAQLKERLMDEYGIPRK